MRRLSIESNVAPAGSESARRWMRSLGPTRPASEGGGGDLRDPDGQKLALGGEADAPDWRSNWRTVSMPVLASGGL